MLRIRRRPWFVGALFVGIAFSFQIADAQYTASFQTNIISGVVSNWSGSYNVGYDNHADMLSIQNGGVLSNGNGVVGYLSNASSNTVLVAGLGSAWINNSGSLVVGFDGAYNNLTITNSGKVTSWGGHLGWEGGANNTALITGTGSVWSILGSMAIGNFNGSGNRLVVSSGAHVLVTSGADLSSPSNSVLVTGPGSVWSNAGPLFIGGDYGKNSMVISNGGQVVSAGSYIGAGGVNIGSDNAVQVTGAGSTWESGDSLAVGFSSLRNSLVISNGGVVVNGTNGSVGYFPTSSNNNMRVVDKGS